MNKLTNVSVGNILAKYFNPDEWALYKVVDIIGKGEKMEIEWEVLAISDWTVKEWEKEAQHHPDMYFFDLSSYHVRSGDVINISDNLNDNRIQYVAKKSIKKILEGDV